FRAVGVRVAGGKAEGIALAFGVEATLAFHRTQERAQLAAERQLLQDYAGAAARVRDDGASLSDAQPVDRQLVGVEAGLSLGPIEATVRVEAEPQIGPDHAHVDGEQLTAKQVPQSELHAE